MSARVARPPIEGRTVAARHQVWLALAAAGDPADVPRLLAIMLDGTSSTQAEARISAIVAAGPDPRVAAALTEVVKAQRLFISKPKFWRAVLDGLGAIGDVRQAAALHASIPEHTMPAEQPGYGGFTVFSLIGTLGERLPRLVARLEGLARALPALTPNERALLDRVHALVDTAPAEDALLAAILAAPDDDTPRAVYADALEQRGDSRGELIALQLARAAAPDAKVSRAAAKREASLLDEHRAALLGPLATVVEEPVFERGFLARCRAVFTPTQRELVDHPLWATVVELETAELALALRPDLRALRHLAITHSDAADELLDGDAVLPRIESLRVPFHLFAEERRRARAAASTVLPGLKRLGVWRANLRRAGMTAVAGLEAALDGRLGAKLEEVVVASREDGCPLELDAWHAALRTRRALRVRFELSYMIALYDGETLSVEMHSDGAPYFVHDELRRTTQRPKVVVTRVARGVDAADLAFEP